MDLDHHACYRARAARCSLRRPVLHRREDDGHLLPSGLSGPDAAVGERDLLFHGSGRPGGGVSPLLRCRPETAPDTGAWRGTSSTVSRALALIELGAWTRAVSTLWPIVWGWASGSSGALSRASRRLTGGGRSDPPRSARQAAHPRDVPVDDRDRVRVGLREHPPIQRDVPGVVRSRAVHVAAREPTGDHGRLGGGQPAAALSASLRLAGHAGVSAAPRDSRHRARRRELLHANHPARRPAGNRFRSTGGGKRAPRERPLSPGCRRCRSSSRGCAASSTWPPIRLPSPPISPRIRRSRLSWRRDRVYACPAPGTASSWRSARCWDSRSRWPPRSVWPDGWWPHTERPWRSRTVI